jgi:signal peptidase II
MSIIFAGAIGNLIDGMFYGMIFDSGSFYDASITHGLVTVAFQICSFWTRLFTFMKGCVVDMFHFPMFFLIRKTF